MTTLPSSKKSYRKVLLATILLASSLPMILISIFLMASLFSKTRQNAVDDLDLRASQTGIYIEDAIDITVSRLLTMATSSDLIPAAQSSMFGAQATDLMGRFIQDNPIVERLDLVNLQGETTEVAPPGQAFQLWSKQLKNVFSDPPISATSMKWNFYLANISSPSLVIFVPLKANRTNGASDGPPLGYVIATIPWEKITPILSRLAGEQLIVSLFNHETKIISAGSHSINNVNVIKLSKPLHIYGLESYASLPFHIEIKAPSNLILGKVAGVMIIALFSAFILLTVVTAVSFIVARRMNRYLDQISSMVSAYADGRYDFDMPTLRYAEFDHLKDLLKNMGKEILRQIEYEKLKARLEAEFESARLVQSALFPPPMVCPGLDVDFRFQAASQTSGDWIGYFYNEHMHRLQIFIADVTGHGMSAALMSGVGCGGIYGYEILKELAADGPDHWRDHLLHCASGLNAVFKLTGGSSRMMSLSIMSLHLGSGHLAVLNAGHPNPWLIRPDKIDVMPSRGPMLGQEVTSKFVVSEAILKPGDSVFAYSDGLVENSSPSKQRLSQRKISDLILAKGSAAEILERVMNAGDSIWGGEALKDDVTTLFIRWQGPITVDTAMRSVGKRLKAA